MCSRIMSIFNNMGLGRVQTEPAKESHQAFAETPLKQQEQVVPPQQQPQPSQTQQPPQSSTQPLQQQQPQQQQLFGTDHLTSSYNSSYLPNPSMSGFGINPMVSLPEYGIYGTDRAAAAAAAAAMVSSFFSKAMCVRGKRLKPPFLRATMTHLVTANPHQRITLLSRRATNIRKIRQRRPLLRCTTRTCNTISTITCHTSMAVGTDSQPMVVVVAAANHS